MTNPRKMKAKPVKATALDVGVTEGYVVVDFQPLVGPKQRAFLPPDMAREIAAELTRGAELVEQQAQQEES